MVSGIWSFSLCLDESKDFERKKYLSEMKLFVRMKQRDFHVQWEEADCTLNS